MTEIQILYAQLGEAVARILEHPDCPVQVFNHLSQIALDIDNDAASIAPQAREAAHARRLLPEALDLLSRE